MAGIGANAWGQQLDVRSRMTEGRLLIWPIGHGCVASIFSVVLGARNVRKWLRNKLFDSSMTARGGLVKAVRLHGSARGTHLFEDIWADLAIAFSEMGVTGSSTADGSEAWFSLAS